MLHSRPVSIRERNPAASNVLVGLRSATLEPSPVPQSRPSSNLSMWSCEVRHKAVSPDPVSRQATPTQIRRSPIMQIFGSSGPSPAS